MESLIPLNPGDGRRARLLHYLRAGDVLVTHKAYSADFEQPPHAHGATTVDLNLEGRGLTGSGSRCFDSVAGVVECFPAGIEHSFRAGPRGIRTMHVHFRAPDDGARPDFPRVLDATAALGTALRIFRELTDPDASTPLVVESLTAELVRCAAQSRREIVATRGLVRDAAGVLRAARSRPIGLAELAGTLGVHRSHLARAFLAATGQTPGDYHRRLRLADAARRLAEGNTPLMTIALETGFADQAHFTRAFGAYAGTTPGRFRGALAS